MTKKAPISITLALILLTAAITVIITVNVFTKKYNKIIGDLPKRTQQYAALQEADEIIRANYYGEFTDSSIDKDMISGLVQSLGDKYCRYLSPADYLQYKADITLKYSSGAINSSLIGKVGYIHLSAFFEDTHELFRNTLQSFTEEEATGLIIDLRNNNSQSLEYAVKVLDLIVPLSTEGNGAMAVTKNSAGEIISIYSSDSESVNLPIAVLINDKTEAAAELFACDLRDFGKAKLFGETSAGHGTLQKTFEMSDGGALLLTVCEIFPYLSDSFNGAGVIPDETVIISNEEKDNLFSEGNETNDAQLSAAVSYFKDK